MEKLKAVVTMKFSDDQCERLNEKLEVVRTGWATTGQKLIEDEMIQNLQDADILLVGYEDVTERVLIESPRLKLIACSRANPVNLAVDEASRRGIPILYAPGRNAVTAAEFTIGLMLAEARHIAEAHHSLKTGKYLGKAMEKFSGADQKSDVVWNLDGESPYKDFQGYELSGRVLGLIGLRSIGRQVARMAKAFDMEIISFDPYCTAEFAAEAGVRLVSFEELLTRADFISMHCKVSEETKGILGKKEFAMMKPTAYVINTARAIVIDQEALIEALQERRISGAALDVYWYEPLPENHPLLKMNNVTLTPHLGGATFDVPKRHSKMIADDILAWLDGQQPKYVFNPEVFLKETTK